MPPFAATVRRRTPTALFLMLSIILVVYTKGFLPPHRRRRNPAFPNHHHHHHEQSSASSCSRWFQKLNSKTENSMHDDDDEDIFVTTRTTRSNVNIDQSLSRPFLNNPQDPKSLLFSDRTPSTIVDEQQQSRNEDEDDMALRVWQTCKNQLPFVLTGASRTRTTATTTDENPIGGVYNIIFVRLPTILAGLVYTKNLLLDGHGMIIDLGLGGPFELPPIVVGAALYVILQ